MYFFILMTSMQKRKKISKACVCYNFMTVIFCNQHTWFNQPQLILYMLWKNCGNQLFWVIILKIYILKLMFIVCYKILLISKPHMSVPTHIPRVLWISALCDLWFHFEICRNYTESCSRATSLWSLWAQSVRCLVSCKHISWD
jgi:hypothetical protein